MKKIYLFFLILVLTSFSRMAAQTTYPIINGYTLLPNPPIAGQSFKLVVSLTYNYSVKLATKTWIADPSARYITLQYCYQLGMLTMLMTVYDTVTVNGWSQGPVNLDIIATSANDTLCQSTISTNSLQTTFSISPTTGLEDFKNRSDPAPYHNALNGSIVLRDGISYSEISLYDLNGRLLQHWVMPSSNELFLTDLLAGCYLIRWKNSEQNGALKILRN